MFTASSDLLGAGLLFRRLPAEESSPVCDRSACCIKNEPPGTRQ
jgi:hypothetical protein